MSEQTQGRLPNFFIIGAPKSGSTALADYLRAHPQVFIPPEKELYFFTIQSNWDRGLDWYRWLFADAGDAPAVGDATPTYIYSDAALERIAGTIPDAKLFAILRNPVDRAYSSYWWERALRERRGFEEAVRAEMEHGPSVHDPRRHPYLTAGRYLSRLQRVCDFFPRESLHVVILEELRSDVARTFAEACRFLGIDDGVAPTNLGSIVNASYRLRSPFLRGQMLRWRAWRRLPRGWADTLDRWNRAPLKYEPMDARLREDLLVWFAEGNAALERWLGRELPAWRR
ncbi:MAG: sulfotransferase family protein [Actinomycetota bacterium]